MALALLLLFCCFECRRCCRSTAYGTRRLRDDHNVSVRYTVQDPRRRMTSDGKVHIVWEVDEDEVEAFENATPMQQVSSRFSWRKGPGPLSEEDNLEACGHKACPMFEDGEAVEYFSRQCSRWLPGTTKSAVYWTPGGVPEIACHVRIDGSRFWRSNIAADAVRLQLQEADPVEVLTQGCWRPAVVAAFQGGGAVFGRRYSARLLDEGGLLEQVSSGKLRRRFPLGSHIEVYRGPGRGWEAAVVAEEPQVGGQTAAQVAFVPEASSEGPPECIENHLVRLNRLEQANATEHLEGHFVPAQQWHKQAKAAYGKRSNSQESFREV